MAAKKPAAASGAPAQSKVALSRRIGRVMSKIPFEQQDGVRRAYEKARSWSQLPANVQKLVTDAEGASTGAPAKPKK